MKYGKHTDLVEAFLTHLKSGNVDWGEASVASRVAAWNDAFDNDRDAWAADWDAWDGALDALDAALDAAKAAAWSAGYATFEIISHERGKPLVFLPMFGIESIEQLKEMVK